MTAPTEPGQLSFGATADWPEAAARRGSRISGPALDATQLSFDWALPVSLGPEDFFVSDSNADAHAMVAGGLRWPEGKLVLIGPQGSGKSHLARIWQGQTGAVQVLARDLTLTGDLPEPGACLAVEDLESLPEGGERALFHLHNHLAATGGRLLMTADRPPGRWSIRLPDLASRVQAAAIVRIGPPDDALTLALMAKQFADRQLFPAPEVLALVARRIERSHAAIGRAVADLDRAGLTERREITTALARRVLDRGGPDGDGTDEDGRGFDRPNEDG